MPAPSATARTYTIRPVVASIARTLLVRLRERDAQHEADLAAYGGFGTCRHGTDLTYGDCIRCDLRVSIYDEAIGAARVAVAECEKRTPVVTAARQAAREAGVELPRKAADALDTWALEPISRVLAR